MAAQRSARSTRTGSGKSAKLVKVSRALDRLAKASQVEIEIRQSLVRQVREDNARFAERNEKRACIVGAWILQQHPGWFADAGRQAAFLSWLKADKTWRRFSGLFGPEADADLLTVERAIEMAAEAGLVNFASDLRRAVESLPALTPEDSETRSPSAESDADAETSGTPEASGSSASGDASGSSASQPGGGGDERTASDNGSDSAAA